MNPLIIFSLIVSSVHAMPNKFVEKYGEICQEYSMYSPLEYLIQHNPNREESPEMGFHFTSETCNEFYGSSVPTLSAYLSDNEKYLFLFISVGDPQVEREDESTKQYIIDLREIRGRFSGIQTKNLFVIWLRELTLKHFDSSHKYRIRYNDYKKTTETPDLLALSQIEEQLILKDFNINSDSVKLNITLDPMSTEGKYTIRDSYLIICVQKKDKEFFFDLCSPKEVDKRISCECESGSKEEESEIVVYIVVLFWCICSIIVAKPIMELLLEVEKKDKLHHSMTINCDSSNYSFKNIITLRLTKGAMDFDLRNVTIDVEFFTHNNENVAPQFRFAAKVLQNRLLTDIKITMLRGTKLPALNRITCKHSGGPDLKIILLGINSQSAMPFEPKGQWFKIHKNIVRNERSFTLRPFKEGEEVDDAEDKALKNIDSSGIRLSFLELLWLLFVNISLIAFIAYKCRVISIHEVFLRMFVSVLISTSIALVFNYLFVKLYKYLLLSEHKQKTKMNLKSEKIYFIVISAYYFISIVIATTLGVLLFFDRIITNLNVYQWLCTTFCATTLFVLVWLLISYLDLFFERRQNLSETTLTVNSTTD